MRTSEDTAPQRRGLASVFVGLSERLLRLERYAVAILMTLLSGAILLNVVTRYLGAPIYWIDEFAVYCMVWLTFFGASAMTRLRLDFAVTMMTERLSQRMRDLCRVLATGMVMVFSLSLVAMCWLWLDPVGIASAGFDARAFSGSTFNFVYTERTQTLNWPTWVLYLILPVFALSVTIHGLANLLEDMGVVEKASRDLVINAEEAVN